MTRPTSIRTYRKRLGDGAPSTVVEIRTPSLEPLLLSAPAPVRASEVADIFAAKVRAPVVAVALPPAAMPARMAPEGLRRFENDTYLSLRAVLGRLIAEGGVRVESSPGSREPVPANLVHPDSEITRWLGALQTGGRIAVAARPGQAAGPPLMLPVGELGHLRSAGSAHPNGVLVNTHFFLLSAVELDSPYAAVGDVFGLVAAKGRILNPPTVRRTALVKSGKGWRIVRIGAEDLEIAFPDGTVVRGASAADARRGGMASTSRPHGSAIQSQQTGDSDAPQVRYRGRASGGDTTGLGESALDVCIQGDHATVLRTGGGLRPPHGALVISFPVLPSRELASALEDNLRVRFLVPSVPDLEAGFQAGPELVRGGEVVVGEVSFDEESFRAEKPEDAAGPVVFPADHGRTSAARVGAGILADGTLVVIAVEGASSLTGPLGDQPAGCTLEALAGLLQEAGAVDAVNFDGGGSSQVVRGAQVVLGSADTRGVPGASFERPVPVAALAGGELPVVVPGARPC